MKKRCFSLVCSINLLILLAAGSLCAERVAWEWNDISGDIQDSDVYSVAADPGNADTVYISTDSTAYSTTDGGDRWKEILSFRGSEKGINILIVSDRGTVYAGTDDGLYRSGDRGSSWEKIFTGMGTLESSVLAVAVHSLNPDLIYAGTLKGLFVSTNQGRDWVRGQNIAADAIVTFIAVDPVNAHIAYAATDTGVFRSLNSGAGWKRVLARSFHGKDYLIPELLSTLETSDEEYHDVKIKIKEETKVRSIAVDREDSNLVCAGTSDGLLISRDRGMSWSPASDIGLLGRNIRSIVISPTESDHVYAATDRGIFRYSKVMNIWKGLYQGIATTDVRALTAVLSPAGNTAVLAATKKGVYKTVPLAWINPLSDREKNSDHMLSLFAHEPTAGEIMEAAIKYADVHPDKIKRWKKAAEYRALLPDLRFGYDKGTDWQRSDYFYSTSKEKYKDDDITKGRDRNWSVSLTWELGDLIWNNDQTSIDNRSKLMVQLRDDILNEVTRLYFERRRLQVELYASPPAGVMDRVEKELRLQELTAGIDALTGSYLSKHLAQSGGGADRKDVE